MTPAALIAIALSTVLGICSFPVSSAYSQIILIDPNDCVDCVTPAYCGDGILQTGIGEECDDGNLLNEDGCSTDCLEEFCGDGIHQAGLAEECDDGNAIDGDGCSGTCQIESPTQVDEQPQTRRQQRCVNALNKDLLRLSRERGRDIHKCIARRTRSKFRWPWLGNTIESCLTRPVSGRTAIAMFRTMFDETRRCHVDPPDFGASSAANVMDAAMQMETDLIRDVLGEDPVIPDRREKYASRCQRAVTWSTAGCRSAKLRHFNSCKRQGLRDGSIVHAIDLEGCMAGSSEDITEACDPVTGKMRTKIDEKCSAKGVTDLAGLFAGCGTDDPLELAVCLDEIIECRVCVALNEANGLDADCDLLDDGMVNTSCP